MYHQVTTVSLAMDQMLGTAMLLIIILAVTDDKNMNIQSSLVPLTIGLGLTAIHLRYKWLYCRFCCTIYYPITVFRYSFGLTAGSAINPARQGWSQQL